ncbi:MAG: AAA family ATPase [Phycisphaerales bacterium]|nr:AAA family ATPase [Phycisphaerales bacterium]
MEIIPQARFKVEGFRVVNQADLILDGITVVAGENGSGKSSLSKILYYTYRSIFRYDELVANQLNKKTNRIRELIEFIHFELRNIDSLSNRPFGHIPRASAFGHIPRASDNIEIALERLKQSHEELKELMAIFSKDFSLLINNNIADRRGIAYRLKKIIEDILEKEGATVENDASLLHQVRVKIEDAFLEAEEAIKNRPIALLKQKLQTVFSNDKQLPDSLNVYEYDSLIASFVKEDVSIPYSIKHTIYMESYNNYFRDWRFGTESRDASLEHLRNLQMLLIDKNPSDDHERSADILKIIQDDIIQGDILVEERFKNIEHTIYKRKDGEIFDINEVATGIKSWAVLLLLLKNNHLNKQTLVIIDEPESNLHPKWIVEFARILVLLNKQIGVKFFIASHAPYTVMAIRYIAEKEGTLSTTNFYIAEKQKPDIFRYNYTPAGQNIESVFGSFNIAIDRMNEYGV